MPPAPRKRSVPARRCAVLAGGRGARMGGEKALAELGGRPLVSHVLESATAAGLAVTIVAKPATGLGRIAGAELLVEPAKPLHPLLGIATALGHHAQPLVVCPCDVPLLPGALLADLAARPEPLVTLAVGGRPQPLIGRFPPTVAGELAEAARAGRPAHEALAALGPHVLDERYLGRFGDPGTMLRNVNTPAELAAIEELLA